MISHCQGWICTNCCDHSIRIWWRDYNYQQRDKHRLASATQRIKKTLKDPGWDSKTSVAGVWLGFSSDYNWSNSAIKSQSLPLGERQSTQRSLISRTASLQMSVSSEGACVTHVPGYIPDSLHSHLLPLSLTNSHSAQNSFLFCELKGEVETGWERWSKEELQRRTEGGRLMEPVSGAPPSLWRWLLGQRGDQDNGPRTRCCSALHLQLNDHSAVNHWWNRTMWWRTLPNHEGTLLHFNVEMVARMLIPREL